MKKLKFLTFAAIAAATAMVSSCSDNDVLEGVKDTGIPFSVTASTNSGGSRGSDITTLSNFQLWGFGTDQTSHFDGDNFVPKSGSTTVFVSSGNTPNWPNTNNCLFYGISDNTSTMAYGVPAGSPGVNSTRAAIRNGSFTYTIPTSVADQKDLLVAAAQGNSANGVNMHFDHALTAAKLHITMNPDLCVTYNSTVATKYVLLLKIQKIIIHNVKISGTYTFGVGTAVNATSSTPTENGSWNVTDGSVGDYVLDFSANPLLYQVKSDETLDEEIDIDGNGSNIYFIPQIISSLNIVANANAGTAERKNYVDLTNDPSSITASYVEINAITAAYEYENVLKGLNDYINHRADHIEWGDIQEQDIITKNAAGDICDDEGASHIIMTHDGFVRDFSSSLLDLFTCTIENGEDVSLFSTVADESAYAPLYKTFKATLGINGNRLLKIEVVNAIRNREQDGAGAYGNAVEAST